MSRRRELATAALPPVVTALCLAMGLAEVVAGKWPPATPIAVAWAVATALPVLAVRTHPIAAWLTEVALTVPLVPLLGQPKSGALFFEDATLLIGLGIGVSSRRRLAWLSLTVVGVVAVITASDHDQPTAGARITELLVTTLLFLGFVGIGCLVAWRSRADRAAREDERRARAESDAEVGRVLSDERARIARDLHDVVAHSVSLMVVQAVGGRAMLDRDPPRALAALDAIDRAGAQALAELARMVEVLADPEPGERPGLARLAALVDGARTLGSEVSLETTGPVDRLPAGVDVAAYRIVQEAVTNGVKHSRGRLAVRVVVDPGVVRLEVSSPLAAPAVPVTGGGYGLLGMRERAALYGGTVDAGPVDGAWVVRAMLPLTATVAVVIRVVLADDEQLMRTGLRMILEGTDDIEVVGEAGNGREAVDLVARTRPDVALVDVRMPVLDGLAATREILRLMGAGAPRVIVLTTFDLDEYVHEALVAGASGFLLKDVSAPGLADAVRAVASGDALLAPSVTRRLIESYRSRPRPPAAADLPGLTDREQEVLRAVVRGLSNREIADSLHVAETTVKTYVSRLLAAFGCRDRVQLVIRGYELGIGGAG